MDPSDAGNLKQTNTVTLNLNDESRHENESALNTCDTIRLQRTCRITNKCKKDLVIFLGIIITVPCVVLTT